MKVRNGFVSNSSSSSFLLYGCEVNKYEVLDLLGVARDEDEYSEIYEQIDDGLSKLLRDTDLTFVAPYEYDDVYIGRPWHTVQDDETGAQFKESIRVQVAKIFGKCIPCETHSGEYAC